MALLAAHPFPIFVRDLSHRHTVHALLDSLQTHNCLNPNIILFSLWFALTEQGRLRRPEFKKLEAALHPWHERITMALQQLASSLQQSRVLRQWIGAEADCGNQFEQQMLAQVLTSDKKTRRNLNQRLLDAGHNLVTYYKVMRIYVNEDIRGDTLKILRLFFVDATDAQIAHSFDEALNAARLDDSGFLQYSLV